MVFNLRCAFWKHQKFIFQTYLPIFAYSLKNEKMAKMRSIFLKMC